MRIAALFATLLLSPALCFAEERFQSSEPFDVISGGIGEQERAEFEAKPDYSLKLIFVGEGGMYLSEVVVAVEDKLGNSLFTARSDGPFLLANLPPGQYKVTATYGGHTKTQSVTVSASGQRSYHFRFPVRDEDAVITPKAPPPPSAPKSLMPKQVLTPPADWHNNMPVLGAPSQTIQPIPEPMGVSPMLEELPPPPSAPLPEPADPMNLDADVDEYEWRWEDGKSNPHHSLPPEAPVPGHLYQAQ